MELYVIANDTVCFTIKKYRMKEHMYAFSPPTASQQGNEIDPAPPKSWLIMTQSTSIWRRYGLVEMGKKNEKETLQLKMVISILASNLWLISTHSQNAAIVWFYDFWGTLSLRN